MSFREEDFLPISGIQHFAFCRRQWALIHIEGQWAENGRTAGGRVFHERAHDGAASEKRGNLLILRGLRIFSSELGVSGECDVVEFRLDEEKGVPLFGRKGNWRPCPVEYKSGMSKENDADRLQLALQAICLEEMLGCPAIESGFLYYGQPRRREEVSLNGELRSSVRAMVAEMHDYWQRGYTPKVRTGKYCNACSLKELCLPALCREMSVTDYIRAALGEEGGERG